MAEARAGIELEPAYHVLYWDLGWALAGLGRYHEAAEALRQATTVAPGDPTTQALFAWALGLAGQREEAIAIRTELERRRTQEYFSAFSTALISVGLGEPEQAISWLEKAAEERGPLMPFLNGWPGFDPLRADPRFQALLRRMNFPETGSHSTPPDSPTSA